MLQRIIVFALVLGWTGLAAAAEIEIDGVVLGAPKGDVVKRAGASGKGDGVVIKLDEDASVEVAFDGKGRVKRIYATHRKGILPLKDLTTRYGEPVKRAEHDSIKYVFTVEKEGTITLEKVKGYPGFYVEAVR